MSIRPEPVSPETGQMEIVELLGRIVGPRGMVERGDVAGYERGARYGSGRALCVVRPASVPEVEAVVRLCVAHSVRVVVQGANTGLVGSSTPDERGEQVVLSTSRLRGRCDVDAGNRSVTVTAGILLHELNEALLPHELWFPIDLGADPSIGGMVSTNTGGTRLVRYGDVRRNLLAVEAVLFDPPGQRVRFGKALRKDNTGFDLKQLFVGTSGVAGVVTQASLEVQPRPKQSATALIVPTSDDAVLELLRAMEAQLGDFLSAFEGMSQAAMRAAMDHVPSLRNPFAGQDVPAFAVLVELESSISAERMGVGLQELLNAFLEEHLDTLVSDVVLGKPEEFWRLRHSISEGAAQLGRTIAFDISVPRSQIMQFRRAAYDVMARRFAHLTVVDFGHIADGGVHFNVVWPHDATPAYDPDTVMGLRDEIYSMVVERFDGSFSAEHGVGPHNLLYYNVHVDTTAKTMAERIKKLLDPQGLCGTVDFGRG
jgi:FAD/FMN-containing dehydrogenase